MSTSCEHGVLYGGPDECEYCVREEEKDKRIAALTQERDQLRRDLEAMRVDRNLWQEQHEEDCPNAGAIEERDQLRVENEVLKERIKTAINAACERCKRGDALFLESSTGFYTHTLGGNYCSAHRYHNLLGSEAANAARRKA